METDKMATPVPEEKPELSSDSRQCSECKEPYECPKVLPCKHIFCEKCIQTMVETSAVMLECPLCRGQCQLPVGGVSALESPTEICGGCEREEATHRCDDCEFFLCRNCAFSHSNITMTATHRVKPLKLTEQRKPTGTCMHSYKPVECYKWERIIPLKGEATSTAITMNTGNFITVSREEGSVKFLDSDGNVLATKEYDGEWFPKSFRPTDITITKDHQIFMTDAGNNQVVVTDENGEVIRCFGQKELKNPYSITISPFDGTVYVTNWGLYEDDGHCIRKYTQDGTYITSFGVYGTEKGEFQGPYSVAVDSKGKAFVSDYHNNRIQVFDSSDKFLHEIGTNRESGGNGLVSGPKNVTVDDKDNVIVIDESRVQKFKNDGTFDYKFEGARLNQPIGLAHRFDESPRRVAVIEGKVIKVYMHCIRYIPCYSSGLI